MMLKSLENIGGGRYRFTYIQTRSVNGREVETVIEIKEASRQDLIQQKEELKARLVTLQNQYDRILNEINFIDNL